jgi:hypothetical protein
LPILLPTGEPNPWEDHGGANDHEPKGPLVSNRNRDCRQGDGEADEELGSPCRQARNREGEDTQDDGENGRERARAEQKVDWTQ